jgi:hypothetical protein
MDFIIRFIFKLRQHLTHGCKGVPPRKRTLSPVAWAGEVLTVTAPGESCQGITMHVFLGVVTVTRCLVPHSPLRTFAQSLSCGGIFGSCACTHACPPSSVTTHQHSPARTTPCSVPSINGPSVDPTRLTRKVSRLISTSTSVCGGGGRGYVCGCVD